MAHHNNVGDQPAQNGAPPKRPLKAVLFAIGVAIPLAMLVCYRAVTSGLAKLSGTPQDTAYPEWFALPTWLLIVVLLVGWAWLGARLGRTFTGPAPSSRAERLWLALRPVALLGAGVTALALVPQDMPEGWPFTVVLWIIGTVPIALVMVRLARRNHPRICWVVGVTAPLGWVMALLVGMAAMASTGPEPFLDSFEPLWGQVAEPQDQPIFGNGALFLWYPPQSVLTGLGVWAFVLPFVVVNAMAKGPEPLATQAVTQPTPLGERPRAGALSSSLTSASNPTRPSN